MNGLMFRMIMRKTVSLAMFCLELTIYLIQIETLNYYEK